MKTRIITVIIPVLLLLLFLVTIIGIRPIENFENRTLATFGMVLNPEERSVVYKDSALERFEEALKDQFSFRQEAITTYLRIDTIASMGLYGYLPYVGLGALISLPSWTIFEKTQKKLSSISNKTFDIVHDLLLVGLLLICIVFIIGGSYNPFLYYRF